MSPKRIVDGAKGKKRRPELAEKPFSTDGECPIWVFSRIDRNGPFPFDISRDNFDHKDFIDKMISFSTQTWAQIQRQTHDDAKSKNHMLDYDGLSKEAKDRLDYLKLTDYSDSIFSFRFNNLMRIIGYRDREKFFVLWYDPEHKVYPSDK